VGVSTRAQSVGSGQINLGRYFPRLDSNVAGSSLIEPSEPHRRPIGPYRAGRF
jgi:hypothetical protein